MAGKSKKKAATTETSSRRGAAKPKLLSGGNPQIAKGEGDALVQAYIAAMPGWKSDIGKRASTHSSSGTCPACERP
jgi:hypothetical protein